ncbi:hypothetical protein [Pseudonocardia spirodelae]|uniref:O-antigen ligase domain-containing protein n=1 Tax=Pseudonocardia spirodelae TaxID=3133431 RepID=A0ABU8T3X9_9PSEU
MVWLYGIGLTVASLWLLPESIRGELLLAKSARVTIFVLLWILVLDTGFRALRLIPRTLAAVGILAFAILVLGGVLQAYSYVDLQAVSLLHATPDYAQRIRGTRFEPSSLGAGMLVAFGIFALQVRSKSVLMGCVLVVWLAVLVTQSRGTLITMYAVSTITAAILLCKELRMSRAFFRSTAIGATIVTLVLSFGLAYVVTSPFWAGFSAETSDATRSIWAAVGWKSVLQYPLGQGYVGGFEILPIMLADEIRELGSAFRLRDLEESAILASGNNDNALVPKTLPAILSTWFGVAGVAAVVAMVFSVSRVTANLFTREFRGAALSSIIFLLISSSYFTSPFSWEQPLILGALLALSSQVKENDDV